MTELNIREKLALVTSWLGDQDEQLSFGLRSTNDAITLYDAAMSSFNGLGEMADEWPTAELVRLIGYDPMEASQQPESSKIATRTKAVEFIKQQLVFETPASSGKDAWHYGKIELRELLDFIYGGPPRSKRERI